MQTFLPHKIFHISAEMLDYRRLGKQRVEAKQILNALDPEYNKKGWKTHPAVLMWKGYEEALKYYANCMIKEWIKRGYNNTMELYTIDSKKYELPPWMGNEEFHKSHRMNLLRKDYDFYSDIFDEPIKYTTFEIESYPYWWPTEQGNIFSANFAGD
jgi:hypothetical protein